MNQRNLWQVGVVITLCSMLSSCQKAKQSFLTQAQATNTVCSYEVVQTYPHDRNAFTQGLIYDRGDLYESTGLNGQSTIRRVDLETGKVLEVNDLEDRYFGEGMTLWKDRLIQLTWVSKTGFVYDKRTFEKVATFNYPTQGWGLTHDGKELILSDGSNVLYFFDPDTFEMVGQVEVIENDTPVAQLNELEFVNGEILANVWMSDRIARIDPETGNVKGWIDLTGIYEPRTNKRDAVLNGIAYDKKENRLFVTGKLWSELFEIDLDCP